MKNNNELIKLYWEGNKNKVIRYYFYVNKGLDLFNNFRYVFLFIFGLYYSLKLNHRSFMVLMFIILVPILGAVGYFSVHHVGKVIDWLNVKFSTHYSNYTYELMELQIKKLEEIIYELKEDNK